MDFIPFFQLGDTFPGAARNSFENGNWLPAPF
jgi:hypothetical protein